MGDEGLLWRGAGGCQGQGFRCRGARCSGGRGHLCGRGRWRRSGRRGVRRRRRVGQGRRGHREARRLQGRGGDGQRLAWGLGRGGLEAAGADGLVEFGLGGADQPGGGGNGVRVHGGGSFCMAAQRLEAVWGASRLHRWALWGKYTTRRASACRSPGPGGCRRETQPATCAMMASTRRRRRTARQLYRRRRQRLQELIQQQAKPSSLEPGGVPALSLSNNKGRSPELRPAPQSTITSTSIAEKTTKPRPRRENEDWCGSAMRTAGIWGGLLDRRYRRRRRSWELGGV